MKLNKDYDIPAVSGYSIDGQVIYIDREVPKMVSKYPIWFLLIVHEVFEKSMLMQYNCGYDLAHKIATQWEKFFTVLLGLSWEEEDKIMQKFVKFAYNEKIRKCPQDLDLAPYQDKQYSKELTQIRQAQGF